MRQIFISEGKSVGIIYHYTYTQDEIKQTSGYKSVDMIDRVSSILDKGLISKRHDYISFTRNFDLKWEGQNITPWGAIRITVDGDSLSDRYSINPYMDYEFIGIERSSGENEERIIWPKFTYLPIAKYILKFDFLKPDDYDDKNELIEAYHKLRMKYPSYEFQIVDKYERYK